MGYKICAVVMAVVIGTAFAGTSRGYSSPSRSYSSPSRSYSKPSTPTPSRAAKPTTPKSKVVDKYQKTPAPVTVKSPVTKKTPAPVTVKSPVTKKTPAPVTVKSPVTKKTPAPVTVKSPVITRKTYYPDYTPPRYYTQSSPSSFGPFEAVLLWAMLDNLDRDTYVMYKDDPAVQQWKAEAERLAANDPEMKQKLEALEDDGWSWGWILTGTGFLAVCGIGLWRVYRG
jgi:hypothetical protein